MTTDKTTKGETPKIRLLKCTKVKDGRTFYNLYIQVGDGNPIAIKAPFASIKVKNMLLAVATPCEIKTTTIVRDITPEGDF